MAVQSYATVLNILTIVNENHKWRHSLDCPSRSIIEDSKSTKVMFLLQCHLLSSFTMVNMFIVQATERLWRVL
jgi:hypothetical protein